MYRAKQYRLRPLTECLEDLATVAAVAGDQVEKVFVADGDAMGDAHVALVTDIACGKPSVPQAKTGLVLCHGKQCSREVRGRTSAATR